jgi:DNA repair protein RadC
MKKWSHPGGKLRELGADALSDAELLAILISTGIRGKPALAIAEEVLERFGSLTEMSNVPLERFLEIKGISDVKIIRIAAALEIARRLLKGTLRDQEE